jgi:tetratricopeptide (TPR) repeat protein
MREEIYKIKDLIKQNCYKKALSELQLLCDKYPTDKDLKFELAKLYFIIKDFNQAKIYFNELLYTNKKNYVLLELGKIEQSLGNSDQAKIYFNELLYTNKRNYALLELGKLEKDNDNFSMANIYLKELLLTSNRDYALLELGKLEKDNDNFPQAKIYLEELLYTPSKNLALTELLDLNIRIKKYDECFKLLHEISKNKALNVIEMQNYSIYLKYKLNKLKHYNYVNTYFCNQLTNYNEAKAIEHIKKHLDENEIKPIHSIFYNDINIEQLYYEVIDKIKTLKPKSYGYKDRYIIDLGYSIGQSFDIETSKVCIITFCDTNNIITMYPVLSNYTNKKLDKIYKK